MVRRLAVTAVLLLTTASWLVGCSLGDTASLSPAKHQETVELTVSVAASLREAMTEIKAIYEKESGVRIHLNFGSSSSLARQNEQGAPVDVFKSASEEETNRLIDYGLMEREKTTHLLTNRLVLITSEPYAAEINQLADLVRNRVEKVAIGIPETVPAGKYAREALRKSELWQPLQHKLVFAKDVRQVLAFVETQNVAAGLVYASDAQASTGVVVVEELDPELHDPIIYPAGVIAASDHVEVAEEFWRYLQSSEAAKVFESYGFQTWKQGDS